MRKPRATPSASPRNGWPSTPVAVRSVSISRRSTSTAGSCAPESGGSGWRGGADPDRVRWR